MRLLCAIALVLFAVAGCVDTPAPPHVSGDASDASTADATDEDSADTSDGTDTSDGADTSDSADLSDSAGDSDETDVVDVQVADDGSGDDEVAPPAPTGESCTDPFVVDAVPFEHSANLALMDDDVATSYSCSSASKPEAADAVYQWTVAEDGFYTVYVAGGFEKRIAVTTDCAEPTGGDACIDATGYEGASTLYFPASAGDTLHIVVDGANATEVGPYTLTLDAVKQPSCQAYCEALAFGCELGPFSSVGACKAACATWTSLPDGTSADQGIDTLGCRLAHAAEAAVDPGVATAACEAASPLGDGSCGAPCEVYCRFMGDSCTLSNAQYGDASECGQACAAFDTTGTESVDADTLQCRAHYASQAALSGVDAAVACAAAGPSGGEICVD